jgi:polyferredoxin
MAKRGKKANSIRLIYQISVFALLFYMIMRFWLDKSYIPDYEAYCPFGGLQALGSFFNINALSCSMTTMQIMMGIMLMLGAILFSKLFCGYICPLGTLSELIGRAGDKLKIRINVPESADGSLRAMKYMLLFATFYFTLNSGELFCRKFDPYYAAMTGFGSDVVILYALIALVVLIAGSLIFRLFWCRYLCPFGAMTNIFRYFWWFAGITFIYIVLIALKVKIPLYIPLIAYTTAGYVLEVVKMKNVKPSPVYISRNEETCTSCNLCSVKCPQEIEVAAMKKVTHIDCNLCGDCLQVCPEKDTLQINRRKMNWLPGLVLGLLIIAGFTAGSLFELPTINVSWGSSEQLAKASTVTVEGLQNVKCYGTSVMYSDKLRKIDGIYGVSTYVGKHNVKVLYDISVYSDEAALKEMLFMLQAGVEE